MEFEKKNSDAFEISVLSVCNEIELKFLEYILVI